MDFLKISVALILIGFSAHSKSTEPEINKKLENLNREATQAYASLMHKPMPNIVAYTYGMKVDVVKLIHISPTMRHCGNIRKLMTYEDSIGELHTISYLVAGECPSRR